MSPVVSVVVPCHNGAATLAVQLEALAAQEVEEPFEVLVVDNNSTDGSAALAASYRDRLDVRVISARGGASVAYARNEGARAARAGKVLFCDADDEVRAGWITCLAGGLDQHDIVGGRLEVTRINGPEAQSWVGRPPDDALATAMRYRPYATGANLGVRASVWDELGGFDESFVGGHEEVEFCWRAIDEGCSIGFVPSAVVDFRLRDTRRGVMRQRFAYGRTYAQLYSRFRTHPIRRSSSRHEVKVVVLFLVEVWPEWRRGNLTRWLAGLAWLAGRYRGDLAHRVRCPL